MSLTIPPYIPPVTGGGTLNGQRPVEAQTRTIAAASTTIPVAYGEVQVGGRVFACTFTGGFWYVGALFCVGEIDSFTSLFLNGVDVKPATPAGMSINYYTGTTSQTADALLASAISGYTDTLVISTASGSVGVAYVVLKYSESHYAGLPTITARVKGRKVYGVSANLINDSEDITGTNWIAGNVDTSRSVNVAGVTAPDGTTTADKIQEATTTSNGHFVATPTVANLPDNAIVTFSTFCKSAERTFVRIMVLQKANVTSYVTVDLSTGIVQNTSGTGYIDSGSINYGGGWYRVWITANVGTGATVPRGRIFTMQSATTQTYAGTVNSGLYVWGSQFELKPSPGVYTKTTTSASAPAWSDNPALCLRDLILTGSFGCGEDVDDLSVKHTANECDALVTTEKRRTLNLLVDQSRSVGDWIDTLATYAGCFAVKEGGTWLLKADRPAVLWQFTSSTLSWTGTNCTLASGATAMTVTQTAADAFIVSPSTLKICGRNARYVRARIRRTSGATIVDGSLYFVTALHGTNETTKQLLTWTAANGTWAIVQWDMHSPQAGSDWTEQIITQIRIDLSQTAGTDVWEIDWISVGIEPITMSSVVAGSFSAGTPDAASIPTVIRVDYTDRTQPDWVTRQARYELAGVSTAAVPRRESVVALPGVTRYSQAYREAVERALKLDPGMFCEFTQFDEGWQTQVGDVLSIIHPYVDTAAATQCDDATLFRVTDAKVIALGRVRVRAVQYAAADYDNTESTTTWGNFVVRAGNLNGSGDGINRLQGRFAGGFDVPDYDGQFPVTKGANIGSAVVGSGNGTTGGPTSGYYGAYAIKINTQSSGTDRVVWFGSSATDYNIAIDPNSQWLFAGKFWPVTANTSVSFSIKSSAGTVYTLTDTTSSAQTWNDFVHTATGSNLLNLTADASDKCLARLDVNASSALVAFDGLMLEKKVGEGATSSPWRPPVASATNPARISPRVLGPGTLDDSVAIDDGNGNSRAIVAGVLTGTVADAGTVTFSPTYARVPTVQFNPTALTYNSAYSASSHALVCEARSLTTSGFTAYIKVRQLATTITARTDTTPTDGGASAVPRYTIQKAASALEAWDDRYKFNFDATVKNIRSGEPGWAGYEPGQLTVSVYIATADSGSPNFTPTWTLVGSVNINGLGGASATTTRSGQSITVVRDGLTQRGGTCPEFGIAITSEIVSGGSVTFTSVTYETATAPTETSATAAGIAAVPYTVIPS